MDCQLVLPKVFECCPLCGSARIWLPDLSRAVGERWLNPDWDYRSPPEVVRSLP
jgi:hypothetical protein